MLPRSTSILPTFIAEVSSSSLKLLCLINVPVILFRTHQSLVFEKTHEHFLPLVISSFLACNFVKHGLDSVHLCSIGVAIGVHPPVRLIPCHIRITLRLLSSSTCIVNFRIAGVVATDFALAP